MLFYYAPTNCIPTMAYLFFNNIYWPQMRFFHHDCRAFQKTIQQFYFLLCCFQIFTAWLWFTIFSWVASEISPNAWCLPKKGVSQMDFQQSNDWTNPTTPALTWQQWVGSDQRDRNQWGGQISHWSVLNNADKSHHSSPRQRSSDNSQMWKLSPAVRIKKIWDSSKPRCLPWLHLSKCLTISSLCIIIYFRHRWKAQLLTDWMTRQKMNFIYHVMVDGGN